MINPNHYFQFIKVLKYKVKGNNLYRKIVKTLKTLNIVLVSYKNCIFIDRHGLELQKLKDMHEAAEKLRRERWIEDKTKKIKVRYC